MAPLGVGKGALGSGWVEVAGKSLSDTSSAGTGIGRGEIGRIAVDMQYHVTGAVANSAIGVGSAVGKAAYWDCAPYVCCGLSCGACSGVAFSACWNRNRARSM